MQGSVWKVAAGPLKGTVYYNSYGTNLAKNYDDALPDSRRFGGATLAIKLPPSPSCPQCGAPVRQRTGKNGAFWSCSRYPDCKGTQPVDISTGKRGASRKQRASRKAS